jgi:glyceraldehyde-3-phosphate dehydrogenase (NADP+)
MKFPIQSVASLLFTTSTLLGVVGAAKEAAMDAGTGTCPSIPATANTSKPPYVTAPNEFWLPDEDELTVKDVLGCCEYEDVDDQSCAAPTEGDEPIAPTSLKLRQVEIGQMPQFGTRQALQVLEQAELAWKGGGGVWTQLSLAERCKAIERFLVELSKKREEIVHALMWEIGKNLPDAQAEFDRTVQFCEQLIHTIKNDAEFVGGWITMGSTTAWVRRAAIGIILCLGPYNYPLNETYATLIPALLMGNIVILKSPTVGGLVHLLTIEAFAKALPPGAIHFVAGSGRATMPPLMKTGVIDGLAFIGGSAAADDLIQTHPHPHRLKVFLQLEANNMAIYLPDVFEDKALMENAIDETMLGTLGFNGQRCTALKLLFVPPQHAESFVSQVVKRVEALRVGLPWQQHGEDPENGGLYSQITPLPYLTRVAYMKSLIADAVSKGAKIQNKNGGSVIGGAESTLMVPAVLYPVTPDMKVYHEEQFGPIVPITTYDDLDSILKFGQEGPFGQQVSIFGQDPDQTTRLLDGFSSVFGKINLNSQCGRSPDTLPMSGRRSSAMGVMSVKDALKEFSIPTVVAYKGATGLNTNLVQGLQTRSKFLEPI